MADRLAQAVRRQWETEAQVRRLNDPFPLSVEWVAADADLVESWPQLRELAKDWPGQPPGGSIWAADAEGLAGQGGEIGEVFERIPTRRLVVLGEPGAGKTMLLIRLLLDLLERRPSGSPVPVLFPLASWDPARQDLYTWMADQLVRDHSALHAPAPTDRLQRSPGTLARALLEWRLIVPVLDGLDELPEAVRALALHAINQVLPTRQPLALSSRTAEYRSALTPPAGATVLLNGAAGIHLLPLDAVKAATYLERDAGGSGTRAAARWRRVTASLGTGTPVSRALSTPLGLFLARTIYNPHPDEDLAGLAHPDELLDQARFPTREDIDTHMFAAFVPAAYRSHPYHPTRWTARQAEHILTFLAHHLEYTLDGTPNLAWWQLPKALPKYVPALAVGLTAGLVFGLMGGLAAVFTGLYTVGIMVVLKFGLVYWFPFALACAVMAARGTWPARDRNPSSGLRWSWGGKSVGFGLVGGLVGGLAGGLLGLFLDSSAAIFTYGGVGGLVAGLAGWFQGGLRSVHPDLDKAVGPGTVLARDRRAFLVIALVGGLAGALAYGLPLGVMVGTVGQIPFTDNPSADAPAFVAIAIEMGLVIGLPFVAGGLVVGLVRSMWVEFLVAWIWLVVLGRVPWRFMSFLADAHERRGVLRQVGAVYQFRHLDLQRHLAGPGN
ncbi:NACHT domain-containing protein [Kitasatospora sp. GP82]|uniref:NACHT domain-containing protein n=1 Tax=Kitasatospora sp. GP82 TaxID=3035089 RepID=UPI002476C42B|nr:NACHT domain-containing protein [Kitasatospora sp. GP82]MDH6130091.1 hypothetical protein [Kitasatospora sp. GP82]